MNEFLHFILRMNLLLLCINSLFIAAKVAGFYTGKAGLDINLPTISPELETSIRPTPSNVVLNFFEKVTESFSQIKNLLIDLLFGYYTLFSQITPAPYSYMATVIVVPLAFIQAVGFVWLISELVRRVMAI